MMVGASMREFGPWAYGLETGGAMTASSESVEAVSREERRGGNADYCAAAGNGGQEGRRVCNP